MCGRYDLSRNAQAIFRFFGVTGEVDWSPRYNIAPSQAVLAIRSDPADGPQPALCHWGFRPRHAESEPDAPTPINARAEKVATAPYFRSAFSRRRAIVPADGWYEWRQDEDGSKRPYRFTRADGGLVLMAGIWTPCEAEPGARLAIITEPARGVARQVHPRMPVVLDEGCWRDWLDPAVTERGAIREVTRPLPAQALRAYPVSRRVGNPANDEPALIEPEGPDLAAE